MPRQEHVLTVFVASPSDVGDERTKLEEVIRELNVIWSRELGIRLELVRWETHSFPGMGDDAQDVINEQIPKDYDLFIGIMWSRYGTQTGRAGSGTVEEFERAKTRYDTGKDDVKIMMYFKDEPLPLSRIDPAQLQKVNEFRESLGEEGALYFKFNSVEHFEELARMHLARQVQAWKKQFLKSGDGAARSELSKEPSPQQEVQSEDDLGILDLFEIFEDQFAELGKITERIGEATEDLGEKITERTNEMSKLPRDPHGVVNPKVAKPLISRTAKDMNQYTARVEVELPLFSDAFNTGMKAFIRVIPMLTDLDMDEAHVAQSEEALEAIITLQENLTSSQKALNEFRDEIGHFPRLTSELNKAKRAVVSVLEELNTEFNNGQTLLRESEASLRDLLNDDDA